MATFPAATSTNSQAAESRFENACINAGYVGTIPMNERLYDVVGGLLQTSPTTLLPATEAITAASAVSILIPVTNVTGPAASTYAITLAAPSAPGIVKVITMTATTGTNAVTLALTNVVGGSAATSASFDAAGETLILISNNTKWVVFKEFGVTLT